MANLKRVGPGSAFKIGLIVYGLLGLIIGACFSLISLLGAGMAGSSSAGMFGMFFSAAAIIIVPICYGLFGGIFAAIGAFIYNLAAGWVGGLEVDIS
ncbi:MAG TPA: hypothetical protein VKR82_15715 [Candidatus Acidoferrales bacterium]|nr:hypothetical protein [Candidatus Acidoferrales bacterium]